ncbi:von Willebrand factor A [Marinibacterium profundimaris]|uniref:von Willebrand factor A n=1 Tax=Marinibacterium profundimaris TaxID=1679460 RepID=A0A225NGH2_9RHOB|nr:DUF1194 domain-containing protein [Marinibacterium profundimaris]OWU72665.1 von Willebrand factor A [Marinibacterium profundimaris]
MAGVFGVTEASAAAECRLALVLAMDVSSSVDAQEDALQRGGLASALLAPEVQTALFASDMHVALAVFEWSGRYNHEVLVDWTLIDSRAALFAVAQAIGASTRSHDEFPTAMGYALGYAAGLLDRAPPCLFQTVDVAGDGENNEGFAPSRAYRHFPFAGVVVNGLAIDGANSEPEVSLEHYYRNEVIRGPGAFVEVARGFEDYERAMRRKLERELRPRVVGELDQRPGSPG